MFSFPLRPGLELRLADVLDADEQFTLLQSQSTAWETFWAWDQPFKSVASWRSYVGQMRQRHAEETGLLVAIYTYGRCVGHLGLDRVTPQRAEIQGWIIPGEPLEAVFHEALTGLIDYVFAVWDVHRVEVRPSVDQTSYMAHLTALGMTHEATLRMALQRNGIRYDAALYGLLASEWTARHPHPDFRRWIDDDLAIRPYEVRDTMPVFTAVDANRAHLRRWLFWVEGTQSPLDTEAYIRGSRAKWGERNGWEGGLWKNDTLIGSVGYHYWDFDAGSTEIGYWLSEAYTGQGLMTRAVRAMVDDALFDLGLNRVIVHCATGNIASNAIPRRLGFTHEGVIREAQWLYDHYTDWNVYSMLSDEWARLAEEA